MFRLVSENNVSVLSYNIRTQNLNELGGMTSEDIINSTNLWMEPCLPNSSSWFKSLKKTVDVFNPLSIFNFMKQQNWSVSSANKYEYNQNSMRTCRGIIGLFKSTILLKAPMDIDIYVKDDGEKNLVINKSMFPKLLEIETHFKDQFSTGNDRFKDYRNLKFCYPFKISSSHSCIFAQPYWHNEVPFDVPPGGLFDIYKKHADLNLNVFYKMDTTKEINQIKIKKGTILAYMIFPHPVSLKVDKNLEQNVSFYHLKNGVAS